MAGIDIPDWIGYNKNEYEANIRKLVLSRIESKDELLEPYYHTVCVTSQDAPLVHQEVELLMESIINDPLYTEKTKITYLITCHGANMKEYLPMNAQDLKLFIYFRRIVEKPPPKKYFFGLF